MAAGASLKHALYKGMPFAKTNIKLNKYKASGKIHNSGNEATSVVKYVVNPSIKLDGIKLRNAQCN